MSTTYRISEVGLSEQRLSLYTVDWQNRRVRMKGSWANPAVLARTIERLDAYLWDGKLIDQETTVKGEYVTRLWRIVNLLDAVYMGWKDKDLDTSHQKAFLEYKGRVATLYHEVLEAHRKAERDLGISWRWGSVGYVPTMEAAWRHLNDSEQKAIIQDLVQRFKNTVRRAARRFKLQDPVQIALKDRPELFWFIERVSPSAAESLMQWSHTYHIT